MLVGQGCHVGIYATSRISNSMKNHTITRAKGPKQAGNLVG